MMRGSMLGPKSFLLGSLESYIGATMIWNREYKEHAVVNGMWYICSNVSPAERVISEVEDSTGL